MERLRAKAFKLGATKFDTSETKNKKYYVVYQGKRINFSSSTGKTFLDHKDKAKRAAWRARHRAIRNFNKQRQLVCKLKTSPSYWSWLLW